MMSEGIERTKHPKIFTGTYACPHLPGLRAQLDALGALCRASDPAAIRRALAQIVPEYGEESTDSEPPVDVGRTFPELGRLETA